MSYKYLLYFTAAIVFLPATSKSASVTLGKSNTPALVSQAKVLVPMHDGSFFVLVEPEKPILAKRQSKAHRAALAADFYEFGTERISNSDLPGQFLHGLPLLAVFDNLPRQSSGELVLSSAIDGIDTPGGSIPRDYGALLIPEPAVSILLAIGLVGLAMRRQHRPVQSFDL